MVDVVRRADLVGSAGGAITAHEFRAADRFARGCAIGAAIATLPFLWMVSGGKWYLLQRGKFGSNFYDVQARSLLHGHWNVPPAVMQIEGMVVGHRTYMYYGPVPALFRIPVVAVTHALDGRLTAISMLIAFELALVVLSRLSWRIRWLVRGPADLDTAEAWIAGGWILFAGMGSILLFLASWPSVYHEAELWGATLALASFDAVLGFIIRPSGRRLAAAGLLAALAVLSRGSIGAAPVVTLGLLTSSHVLVWSSRLMARRGWRGFTKLAAPRTWGWLALPARSARTYCLGLAAATGIPVALYAAVNEVKFHTLFSLPLNKQIYSHLSPDRQAALAANRGSLFGLKFVPTTVLQYIRPDALNFHHLFPWIFFPTQAKVLLGVRFDTLDPTSSASASMPFFVATALVGLLALCRRPRRSPGGGIAAIRTLALGAAAGTLASLSIAFVANRYLSDAFPFLALCSLVGMWSLYTRARSVHRLFVVVAASLAMLAGVFGIWTSGALALVYQKDQSYNIVTRATRGALVSFQERIDAAVFGGRPSDVQYGPYLPRRAPTYGLFVLGHCDALYVSDGAHWAGVEEGNVGGHYRMAVSFPDAAPDTREPLLIGGSIDNPAVLAVHFLPGQRISLSYQPGKAQKWQDGHSMLAQQGRSYVVDVTMDRRANIDEVSATVDGAPSLELIPFFQSRAASSGSAVYPVPSQFHGTIVQLPVQTPMCDSLLRRSNRGP